MKPESEPKIAPLLLRKAGAAEALSVSVEFFEEYVMPEIAVVRRGRLVLVPVVELERWVSASMARTVGT